MVAIDIVLIVGGVLVLALMGGLIGQKIDEKRQAQDDEKRGAANYGAAKQAAKRICVYCLKAANAEQDIYDPERKQWWCSGCWRSFH